MSSMRKIKQIPLTELLASQDKQVTKEEPCDLLPEWWEGVSCRKIKKKQSRKETSEQAVSGKQVCILNWIHTKESPGILSPIRFPLSL